ncbi:MAG: hypothetical protein DCC67_14660 [Planctomycetota bacterium]|nr:MAG: hypothetical protein DCC67_14660 [Planctomycetota bacterium]
MPDDRSTKFGALAFFEATGFTWTDDEEPPRGDVVLQPPASYRAALSGEPIRVGAVEFQIMLLLASRPYHAFTRREIGHAVGAEDDPLSEAAVDDYVGSLRDQLGVFHDYVQTVHGVGYRFKP